MVTHSQGLDRRLDTYRQIARRRADERMSADQVRPSHWKRFAAATGATLAGVATADGAIVHVVPEAPIRVTALLHGPGNYDVQQINLDGVGANELFLGAGSYTDQSFNGYRYFGSLQGTGNGAVLIGDAGNVKRLANNTVIPATPPTTAGALVRASATSYSLTQLAYTRGEWDIADNAIAGFVFGPAGSRRAGWIQIRTLSFRNFLGFNRMRSLEVVQWAYESVPGMSIKAGQTTSVNVPGDYDGNGTVGPEDYALWKTTFGNTVTAGTGADGNQNGKVDAADYVVWRNNKTAGSGSLSAETAVPEPSTMSLGVLALGAAGVAALRRRTK